jgi:hypothetical protein
MQLLDGKKTAEDISEIAIEVEKMIKWKKVPSCSSYRR